MIIMYDKKIIVLKSFKTGSTTLMNVLAKRASQPTWVITDTETGHEGIDFVREKVGRGDLVGWRVMAVVREPLAVFASHCRHYIFAKKKRRTRVLNKVREMYANRKYQRAYTLFWLYALTRPRRERKNFFEPNSTLITPFIKKTRAKVDILAYDEHKHIRTWRPFINQFGLEGQDFGEKNKKNCFSEQRITINKVLAFLIKICMYKEYSIWRKRVRYVNIVLQ